MPSRVWWWMHQVVALACFLAATVVPMAMAYLGYVTIVAPGTRWGAVFSSETLERLQQLVVEPSGSIPGWCHKLLEVVRGVTHMTLAAYSLINFLVASIYGTLTFSHPLIPEEITVAPKLALTVVLLQGLSLLLNNLYSATRIFRRGGGTIA